jgi:hypothetical protein
VARERAGECQLMAPRARVFAERPHGCYATYKAGCHCAECTAANAAKGRTYRATARKLVLARPTEREAACFDCGKLSPGFRIDGRWHCRVCMLAGALSTGVLDCLLHPVDCAEALRARQSVQAWEHHGKRIGKVIVRSIAS